jgi:hypothetical protein
MRMIPGPTCRCLLLAATALLLLPACSPPEHSPESSPAPSATPAPLPTPSPSPTPIYVPYKHLDTGKLFNGIQLQSSFSSQPGGAAAAEVANPASYALQLNLSVRVPRAVDSAAGLTALNPGLPAIFPAFGQWIQTARVSPFYERVYRHKLDWLQHGLLRLDQLLSRHDFYDCETILEVQPPGATRKILWIQSAMDVDSDGSDSDRVPDVDGSSLTFQPITSYKWPKRGTNPNPFLAPRETRLDALQASLATAATASQRHQIMDSIGDLLWEIKQLRANSFLVAADDPYIVVPGTMEGQKDDPYSPAIGDYCAIVYGNVIYPAIVGDVGPSAKVGEASLRIAQQINPLATSENRPVSALKISYLIFPGTAEHPFSPPDLDHWHDRVDALLKEAGGYNAQLFAWKDLTAPPPTPTPTPPSSPSPSPGVSPAIPASPAASPSAAPSSGS